MELREDIGDATPNSGTINVLGAAGIVGNVANAAGRASSIPRA